MTSTHNTAEQNQKKSLDVGIEIPKDQSFSETLEQNWQKLLGILVVVFLGVWLWHEFQNVTAKKAEEASQRLAGIQENMEKLTQPQTSSDENDKSKENRQAALKALEENIQALESDSPDSVYGNLAKLYNATRLLNQGQYDSALELLRKDSPVSITLPKDISKESFLLEVTQLLEAKALLSSTKPDEISSGKKQLAQLVREGQMFNVEALFALAAAASQTSEKQSIAQLQVELAATHPEFADLSESELLRLGIRPNKQ